jgi:hypothetical protein
VQTVGWNSKLLKILPYKLSTKLLISNVRIIVIYICLWNVTTLLFRWTCKKQIKLVKTVQPITRRLYQNTGWAKI